MKLRSNLPAPTPMAGKNQPVDWLFAFKFNADSFPGCTDSGATPPVGSKGIFGGTVEGYPHGHSQQYVFATSQHPTLVKGTGCLGATLTDPLGATFAQVYNQPGYFYVLWNDQFYNNPIATEFSPWGHSKGMVAWNDAGEGFSLQVSTPSWPASGSRAHPRQNDGNTLGCIHDDDIMVSQHFFALKLTAGDLASVLKTLANASVVTNLQHPEIVRNGGPAAIQSLVTALGQTQPSTSTVPTCVTLSSGVQMISKPSALHVAPWQMVSAQLKSLPLRVASWWMEPNAIPSTTAATKVGCWQADLGKPGAVAIATSGMWNKKSIGLQGGMGGTFNHAKIGISTDPKRPLSIFGDMNQQGTLTASAKEPADVSQNGRGGTFYVVNNAELFASLTQLLKGDTAPTSELTSVSPVKAGPMTKQAQKSGPAGRLRGGEVAEW